MIRFFVRSAVLVFLIGAPFTSAMATDTILEEAAKRCAQFDNDVKDMRLVQAMRTVSPDGELTFEQTVYIKGKKSRVEMSMPLAAMQGGEGEGSLVTIMVNDGQ